MFKPQVSGIILLLSFKTLLGVKLTAIPISDDIITPCPGEESHFLTNFVSLDLIKFNRINDETLAVTGNLKWKKEQSPLYPVSVTVDVFKFVRGQWMQTVFSLKRDDLCKVLYSPLEFWYIYTKNHVNKKCPPLPGTLIPVNTTSNLVFNVPPRSEGLYRGKFVLRSVEGYCCFLIDAEFAQTLI